MAKKKERHMPTGSEECIRQCGTDANACRDQAQNDYDAMRAACQAIADPTQRAQCFTQAATAYQAAIGACQSNFELCVQICKGGTTT